MHPLDEITITGLSVFAHHGVFDFERRQGQEREAPATGESIDLGWSGQHAGADHGVQHHAGEVPPSERAK